MMKITFQCEKCRKEFELTSGPTKDGASRMSKDEISIRDAEKSKAFVQNIFDHDLDCHGNVRVVSKAFLD